MKKIVFLMGIAAVVFASCAKDSVSEANLGKAIDFRVAAQTRATETTTANLNKFKVTAISTTAKTGGTEGTNYFTGITYERAEGETYYLSDPVYYWPKDGALNFYAYAPENLANVTISKDKKEVADFAPAESVADQVDFITANTTEAYSDDVEANGVALEFTHELSQIQVKAKNNNTGYKYTVKAFKIGNVVGKGTFDFTEEVGERWDLSNDDDDVASYMVAFAATELPVNGTEVTFMGETNSAMLLPQELSAWTEADNTGTYFAVLAKVETSGGTVVYPKTGDYGWLAVAVNTVWEAGYKYVYTLDFTKGAGIPVDEDGESEEDGDGDLFGGPIKFDVEVNVWEDTKAITIEKTTPDEEEEENGEVDPDQE